jgi:hypothetical protein
MIRLTKVCIKIVILLILCSCDTPINKYVPMNDNEKDIIETLDAYLVARNSNDTQNLANLFDEVGEYIAGDGTTMKGKNGIANSDPVWWTQYGKQKILNPKFHIEESKATVSTIGKWGLGQ